MAKTTKKTPIPPEAAFAEGQCAFGAGQAVSANPYQEEQPHQHDAAFAWRRGWCLAHLHHDRATGHCATPLYSVFPAVATHEQAQAVYEAHDRAWRTRNQQRESPYTIRDEYAALPWAMEQLIGSTWVNLHTRTCARVLTLHVNTWGRREPVFDGPIGLHDDHVHCTINGPGFWANQDRYVIEHWIRYDTLPPAVQASWKLRAPAHETHQVVQRPKRGAADTTKRAARATSAAQLPLDL